MGFRRLNRENGEWEDQPELDKLWEKYMELSNSVYTADEWNMNSDNSQRQRWSNMVVRKLVKEWSDSDIRELMPLLYEMRNVREWQILREMGY